MVILVCLTNQFFVFKQNKNRSKNSELERKMVRKKEGRKIRFVALVTENITHIQRYPHSLSPLLVYGKLWQFGVGVEGEIVVAQ